MLTMLDRIKPTYEQPSQISEAFILKLVNSSLHTTYGFELLKKWNLPIEYCESTRDHHSEVLDKDDIFLMAIQMGNKACNNLDIGLREKPLVSLTETEQFLLLGLTENDMTELEEKLEASKILAS